KVRRSGVVAIACASALAAPPAHAAAQTLQRSLYVSVVNEAGAPVPDLGPADFIVREDNVAREVLRVAPADEPMQVAVLVDTSQGARNTIQFMRQELPAFVTALTNPNESGAKNQDRIIAFGERPTVFAEYTSSPKDLQKAINRIWSQQGSGAYFLDAVYETAQGFKQREASRP